MKKNIPAKEWRKNSLIRNLSGKLKQNTALFRFLARFSETEHKILCDSTTDLVIEGPYRVANHFAVYNINHANGNNLKIAHHFHAPANLMIGLKLKKPCLLLLRKPRDQIASYLSYFPNLSVKDALLHYIDFYNPLLEHADEFVISDFKDTTQNINRAISLLNAKYNMSLNLAKEDPNASKEAENLIRKVHSHFSEKDSQSNPLPSQKRSENNRLNALKYDESDETALKAKAEKIYGILLQESEIR